MVMESGRTSAPDACTRSDRRAGRGRAAGVKAARAVAHVAAAMAAAGGLCCEMCNDGGPAGAARPPSQLGLLCWAC